MIHIIIKEERRKADAPVPADIAARRYKSPVTSMNNDLRVPNGTDANGMPKFTVTTRPPQLHTMAKEVNDMSNIAYAASWNMSDPFIVVLSGSNSDLKLRYFGWPEITEEEWKAANPKTQMVQVL